MKTIGVIIPALEHNEYHEQGDLAPFGDITLLDWKIAQVKKVVSDAQIYISSPSEKIGSLARRRQTNYIQREFDLALTEMITFSISQIKEETALWANVTSPFIGPNDYRKFVAAYHSMDRNFDSLATAVRLNEYTFFQNKTLNFELHNHTSRRRIEPIYILTNGCFIINRQRAMNLSTYFGKRPFLYLVDQLTSLEIKDLTDLTIANHLLALYFRHKEFETR